MFIRPVEPGDFAAIAALTNEFIRGTAIHFGYEEVTAEELRRAWEKSRSRYPYFVAVDEAGGLVGYAKAGVWRERAAYQWTAETTVYVAPAMHRRGVGRALYSALIEECRRRGFHSVMGGITLPNEASVRLHESLGFRKIGHHAQVGWKFGRWHDTGLWQLMLREGAHRAEPLPPMPGS